MSKVSVVKLKDDLEKGVALALEKAGFVGLSGKKVLVKPNLVEPRSPESGDITNPRVIEAIIKYCYEKGAQEVIVGDGPSYYQSETKLKDCFTRTGVSRVAEKLGARWVVFDDYSYRTFKNFSTYTPAEFRVSEFVFNCDVLINLPVMKTHFMSKVTLAMKNLKGCLKREDKPAFHRNLAKAVVQLNKIIRPQMNIVDGTLIKDNPPLLVAGSDIVAVDSVASSIMGFNPDEVEMIKFGFKEGLGEMNLDKIEIVGDPLSGIKMNLKTPAEIIKKKFPAIELLLDQACCGCLIPILSSLSELGEKKENIDKTLKIVAGKEKRIKGGENTIFIGECTKNLKNKFYYIEGCPPEKENIKKVLEIFFS